VNRYPAPPCNPCDRISVQLISVANSLKTHYSAIHIPPANTFGFKLWGNPWSTAMHHSPYPSGYRLRGC